MEFIISGIHFPISEEMKNYRYYRKLFSGLADQVASEFDALYTKQNHRLEDIIQNGSNQYAQCMYPVIQTALKCLAEKGILSYDAAGFWSKYGKYFDYWSEAYDHLEEQYAAIVLDEKSMDEYRTLRRKTRGRVVGGGFGVGGALKGMAAAGAMNAAAGAAHMMINGIGKIGSSFRSSSKLSAIFNNPDTKKSLVDAVRMSVFSCHNAVIMCIFNHIPSFPCTIVTPEDSKQSYIQIDNLRHIADNPERVLHSLPHIWKLNPYNLLCYRVLLKILGDADGELSRLAGYFDCDILPDKLKLMEERRKELSISTEVLAQHAHDQLCKAADRLGLSHDCDIILEVDKVLHEFDRKARTVDGIELKTREEAAVASKELQEIRKAVAMTDCHDKTELAVLLPQLEKYQSPVAKKHIRTLRKTLEHLLEEEKCVHSSIDGIPALKFDSAEQAQAAAKEMAQAEAILGSYSLNELDQITQAQQAITDLNLSQPVDTAVQKMLQQQQISAQKVIDCTFLGKLYNSVEEKKTVEKEYHKIKTKLMMHPDHTEIAYIRKQLDTLDFPEQAYSEIEAGLAPYEGTSPSSQPAQSANHKAPSTSSAASTSSAPSSSATPSQKAVDTIISLLILAIIIAAIFVRVTVTPSFEAHSIRVMGYEMLISRHQTAPVLTAVDGLKNGILVFGETIVAFFMEGFSDFIAGFHFHFIGNALWLLFGWMWIIIKETLVSIGRYFVTIVMIGKESTSIGYLASYIGSALVPWILCWISNRFGSKKD